MGATRRIFEVADLDLELTLESGQAFRWQRRGDAWTGVVGRRVVRLHAHEGRLIAETPLPCQDWEWLVDYLQLKVDLGTILNTFPADEPMRMAAGACRGLRLLRQERWECLASFILSSTKQIVQIRQVVETLCQCFGDPVATFPGDKLAHAFPDPARLAAATESELRGCKMGFRAPYLLETARLVAGGKPDLAEIGRLPLEEARERLMDLPGVGRKIADCVLLFGYGFAKAFPVDVWVMRALESLYFEGKRVPAARLHAFAHEHFGPHAGYAQQYLFHYMRTRAGRRGGNPRAG